MGLNRSVRLSTGFVEFIGFNIRIEGLEAEHEVKAGIKG